MKADLFWFLLCHLDRICQALMSCLAVLIIALGFAMWRPEA